MRLLTRSDFDGLACGALLKGIGLIDSWKYVHPKDMQDGIVEVTSNDILANIPYAKGCGMWFDHHSSEESRLGTDIKFEGVSRRADSAARVIYEYYGGRGALPNFEEMVQAVDKVDSARLTIEEVLNPTGWILLGFVMDARTGLGRFRDFRISNYDLMEVLMDACATQSIDEMLANPDVVERTTLYFEQDKLFREMLAEHTRVDGNVIISDLRDVDTIYAGNRFLVYSLYPEQNVSLWIVDGRNKLNVSVAVGHSIMNRTCKADIGELMLANGGGGHPQVGTCQIIYDDADKTIADIVAALKE